MRPIKFRAWNVENKQMWYPKIILIPYPIFLPSSECDEVWYTASKSDKGELIFMEFTGLLDKNNKEIYEGDILQWMGLKLSITVDDFHGYRFMLGKDLLCRAHAKDGEVIGNIYSNPELLEKK